MNGESDDAHQDAESEDLLYFLRNLLTLGKRIKRETYGADIAPSSQHPDSMFFDMVCSN
jgi:hypothetical protein